MSARWRKYKQDGHDVWKLKVGLFKGEVIDDTANDKGYIGYVNGVQVTQKFQTTARRAKVIVLLAIRGACKEMLAITDRMNTDYC